MKAANQRSHRDTRKRPASRGTAGGLRRRKRPQKKQEPESVGAQEGPQDGDEDFPSGQNPLFPQHQLHPEPLCPFTTPPSTGGADKQAGEERGTAWGRRQGDLFLSTQRKGSRLGDSCPLDSIGLRFASTALC